MALNDTIGSVLEAKDRKIWAVTPDTSVYDALCVMAEQDIGAVLVMQGERLCGVLSERDYARKVILTGKSSRETEVAEIMSEPGVVTRGTTVDDCMREMTGTRVRHVVVMDNTRVTGVISIGDLVNWVISQQERTINDLHAYVAGSYPG
ncbi:MAG TPA: CBS domain-containing protein [Bryobacteraceae bacterium]|nr:CBS domain-containing protein [Bryobacteraceae bacterium]